MLHLLRPAWRPGTVGWDESVLVLVGLIVLIVIATTGGKADRPPADPGQKPLPGER